MPTSGSSPLAVSFSDTSSGAPTSWSWTFGDGSTSAAQSPTHTYTTAGTYSVTLTAANAVGSNTATQTNVITVVAPPPPPPPSAAFVAAPGSGTAPLTVSFTDTSGGTPTSWSWAFGDGGTSTSQNPSHTYVAPGTFTATLTATNATGSGTATQTVTVGPAPGPVSGGVTAGSSTAATATTATSVVSLMKPEGVVDGDVLIANINADANPKMSSVPSGWRAVAGALSVSTGARVFSYYRVVGSASTEPPQYTFKLSSAKSWNAGVTVFHGVNQVTPFDTAAATKIVTGTTTAITVPSVTTVTPGAMLVGGVGLNSTVAAVAPPTGWTEAWEADGGQNAELGYRAAPLASASGSSTWALSAPKSGAAWVRALKPA
jgi:PKD repeat protein